MKIITFNELPSTPYKDLYPIEPYIQAVSASVLTNQLRGDGVVFDGFGVAVVESLEGALGADGNSIVGIGSRETFPSVAILPIFFRFVLPNTSQPTTANDISFTVGDGGNDFDVFEIRAYDLSNNLIDIQNVGGTSRGSVRVSKPGIHRIEVFHQGQYGYSLDDLSFELETNTGKGIYIESKPVVSGLNHLYLVYRDENNSEKVIRGGPERNIPTIWGTILTEVGVPIEESEDTRLIETPADRGSRKLDLNGRQADDVWNIMLQKARDIGNAKILYKVLLQNSNSTIASVLHSIGINAYGILPFNTTSAGCPGMENKLRLDTNLIGNKADDIIFGGSGSSKLSGNGGNDKLFGEKGGDILIGGVGNDTLIGGVGNDTLIGGAGNDYIEGGNGIIGDRDNILLGRGNDVYKLSLGGNIDVIQDFNISQDRLMLPKVMGFQDIKVSQINRDTLISFNSYSLALLVGIDKNLISNSSFIKL